MAGSGFMFHALVGVLGLHASFSNAQFSEESYQVDRSVVGNMKDGQTLHSRGNRVPVIINREHAQVAELMMGSPPQKLTCLLDSGSSDLWLPSKRCQRCQNLNSFDVDTSRTFIGTRQSVHISYGSGNVAGFSVRDAFQIGNIKIESQPFIIVEDAALPKRQWDGICGLGWQRLAKVGPTLYESMQKQALPALFSIVPTSNAARLVLGEMPSNASMQPNTLKWVPAEQYDPSGGMMGGSGRTFWVVSGGVQIKATQPVPARFLVDTGTNQVLMVPPKYYQSFIRSLIPSSVFDNLCGQDPHAGVVCDCSIMNQQLKPLQIHLGGHAFVLPVSKMFMKVPATMRGEMCMLTIQPNMMSGGSGGLGSILGGLLGGQGGLLGGGLLGGLLGPTVRTGRRLQETLGQLLGDLLSDSKEAHKPYGASQPSPAAQAPFPWSGQGTYEPDGSSQTSPSAQKPSLGGQEANRPYGSSQPSSAQAPSRSPSAQAPTLADILGTLGGRPEVIIYPHGGSQPSPAQAPSLGGVLGGRPEVHYPHGSSQPPAAQAPSVGGVLGGRPEVHYPHGSSQPPPAQAPSLGGVLGGGQSPPAQASVSDPSELWMLGGPFLEHFVTIFDFDHGRLGFAEPAGNRNNHYSGLFELKADVAINHSQSSWLTDVLASAAFGGFVLGSLLGLRSLRLRRPRQDSLLIIPAEDVELAIE